MRGGFGFFNLFSLLILFSFFSMSFSQMSSDEIVQVVDERVVITELLNGEYTISISGTFEITNPTLTSRIYEYRVLVEPPKEVFGSFSSVQGNTSIVYLGFKGYDLMPNETLKLKYSFSGDINSSEIEYFENGGSFIEKYASSTYVVKSSISIDKPIREDENSSVESRRYVSSLVKNPSEFSIFVKDLEVYRTLVSDVFMENSYSLGVKSSVEIEPFKEESVDFEDESSSSNSIYWVRAEVSAQSVYNVSVSYSFKKQSRSGGSSDKSEKSDLGVSEGSGLKYNEKDLENLVVKKDVDKVLVSVGEDVSVFVNVINLGKEPLYNISFIDEIPKGYELKAISSEPISKRAYKTGYGELSQSDQDVEWARNSVKVEENMLYFLVDKIEPYSQRVFKYVLTRIEEGEGSLTYLKPVEFLNGFGGQATVEGVLLLDSVLGSGKLFVQKEVEWLDSKYSKVEITIKNVGEGVVSNFKLIDEIEERYIIKDILKSFSQGKRGEWKIDELTPNSQWSVSYLVESHEGVSQLPLLVGVEQSEVYGTLLFDSQVHIDILQRGTMIEKIGFGVTIFLVLLYFLF